MRRGIRTGNCALADEGDEGGAVLSGSASDLGGNHLGVGEEVEVVG